MTDDMDPDLRDLLAGWSGHELPPERYQQLLDRLETDVAFRGSFSAEVWTLAEVFVATDEDGLTLQPAGQRLTKGSDFDGPAARPARWRPDRRRRPLWAPVAVAAGLVLAVAAGWLGISGTNPGATDPGMKLAVVVHSAGAVWEEPDSPSPTVGTALAAGPVGLKAGVAVLLGIGGETTAVEGPAELELSTPAEFALHRGRVRVKVPDGTTGFTVKVPGAAIVGIGAEFGVSVLPDGRTHVAVFSGRIEVLHTPKDGPTQLSGVLKNWEAAVIDPDRPGLTSEPMTHRFPVMPYVNPPAVPLGPDYPAAVRAANPWGYWRFEDMDDKGATPNEIAGRPPFRKSGAISLAGKPGERAVVFRPGDGAQFLAMDGEWTPPATGFALEFWVMPEMLRPQTIAALIPVPTEKTELHSGLVEVVGLRSYWPFAPGAVRFLYRNPPTTADDTGLVSEHDQVCSPYRWHHVVAQRAGDVSELYLDGRTCGSEATAADASPACRLLLGRLKKASRDPMQVRGFVGQMDEVAVYDRPLTADEIRRHAEGGRTK